MTTKTRGRTKATPKTSYGIKPTLIGSRLKGIALGVAAYDAAVLALLALIAWEVLA